jgi:hypothetical protein
MPGKRKTTLTLEDLEAAKQRAISAGPLPDAVRREFEKIWDKQSNLPVSQRSLAFETLLPSGWVLTHLVPIVCKYLSRTLRQQNNEAGLVMAKSLDEVSDLVAFDLGSAIEKLVQPRPRGDGSRFAGQCQINVLRILDFGLIGLPFIASVYANSLGISDIASSLLADGELTLLEVNEVARTLDDYSMAQLSEGDLASSKEVWIPSEFFTPDNFNPSPVKGISTG